MKLTKKTKRKNIHITQTPQLHNRPQLAATSKKSTKYKQQQQTRQTENQPITGLQPPENRASTQPKDQPGDHWGHAIGPKNPNTIRLLLQNMGGIDLHPRGSVRLAALQDFMTMRQVDIAVMTECDSAWQHVDFKLWPQQQTKSWWENTHWSLTYNRQDPDAEAYQPGGVGKVVVNQLSYRAQRPGDDTVSQGRWCRARLRGKHNQYLRVVSLYRPCKSSGPLSTYQQQVRFWSSKQVDTCPCDQILYDL